MEGQLPASALDSLAATGRCVLAGEEEGGGGGLVMGDELLHDSDAFALLIQTGQVCVCCCALRCAGHALECGQEAARPVQPRLCHRRRL